MSKKEIKKQLISLTPDAIVELFEIDFSNMQENAERIQYNLGASTSELKYRFCSSINHKDGIVWQGKTYQPLPINAEGFESKNDGRLPRPKLIIANPDGIFSKIIYGNDDFVGCKVTRRRTYVRFLDDVNFAGNNLNSQGKNPFGQSDTDAFLPEDIYYINKKTSEDKQAISFELSSSLELRSSVVPARRLMSNLCSWTYRCDIGCKYKGPPIETLDEVELEDKFNSSENFNIEDISEWNKGESGGYNAGDVVKIISKRSSNPYIQAPQVFVCVQGHQLAHEHHPFFDKNYWLKDDCPKNLSNCKKRFERNEDNTEPLNFGGFPGVVGFEYEN